MNKLYNRLDRGSAEGKIIKQVYEMLGEGFKILDRVAFPYRKL